MFKNVSRPRSVRYVAAALVVLFGTGCATTTPSPSNDSYCLIAEPITQPKSEIDVAPRTQAGVDRENQKFYCTCDQPQDPACK